MHSIFPLSALQCSYSATDQLRSEAGNVQTSWVIYLHNRPNVVLVQRNSVHRLRERTYKNNKLVFC